MCPPQEEVPETSQKSFADVKGCPEAKVAPVAASLMALHVASDSYVDAALQLCLLVSVRMVNANGPPAGIHLLQSYYILNQPSINQSW